MFYMTSLPGELRFGAASCVSVTSQLRPVVAPCPEGGGKRWAFNGKVCESLRAVCVESPTPQSPPLKCFAVDALEIKTHINRLHKHSVRPGLGNS